MKHYAIWLVVGSITYTFLKLYPSPHTDLSLTASDTQPYFITQPQPVLFTGGVGRGGVRGGWISVFQKALVNKTIKSASILWHIWGHESV